MKRLKARALSLLLTAAMLLTLLPAAAFAAETDSATWEPIALEDIQPDDTIAVTMTNKSDVTYGLYTTQSGTYGPAAQVVTKGLNGNDSVLTTGPEKDFGWKLSPVEGGGFTLSVGEDYLYTTAANNGVRINTITSEHPVYIWSVDSATGYLTAKDTDGIARYLGVYDNNNGESVPSPNWRAYKNTTGNTKEQILEFWKLSSDPGPVEPTATPMEEAKAGVVGTEYRVKGVVTLLDGKNIYLQDATGGVCVRFGAPPADINLGDTILATGTLSAPFNGLPQLTGTDYVASSGLTLKAKNTTISALSAADLCTYISLSDVEITEIYDNNGVPNITVKDAEGETIQIYKAVVEKQDGAWVLEVGDKIDVTAAVGIYNTSYQLRTTNASEIQLADERALNDGDRVVIYNPAHGKALSGDYTGFYNKGTDVTVGMDDTLTGFTDADVWTVGVNSDGTYSFSYNGEKIGMGDSFSSMPLGEKHDSWEIIPLEGGLYNIKNVGRNAYMEWYSDKGSWSSYGTILSGQEDLFALSFYKVTGDIPGPGGDFPEDGDQVMLYNKSSLGVLAAENDSESVNNAAATIAGDKVHSANGGRVFTVEKNGAYYRFKTEYDGYLCSNGTGNNAFYQKDATNDADWTLAAYNGGYSLESRTAKYNNQYSQFLEYYGGSYKTYSMYQVTDKDIYTFIFYPSDNDSISQGVVNEPAVVFAGLGNAYLGVEYTVSFTVDAPFGVKTLTATYNETVVEPTLAAGQYSFTIPAGDVMGENMALAVNGTDTLDVPFSATATVQVLDEPIITAVTPAAGSQTGDEKRPAITASFANAGVEPTITMTVNDAAVTPVVAEGTISYAPDADLADGRYTVTVTITRADQKSTTKTWSFTVGISEFQLYFGQLHSHTTYSDGSGTLDSALSYVKDLPESANVDFVAFTDHSNYFDDSGPANPEAALYDMSQATSASQELWGTYKDTMAAFNAENNGRVALAGFEMTWSGGPGHINTFNTDGIVSRNNDTLNSKAGDAGMKAYYALLSQTEGIDSISQFNHPGNTFGTFSDFAYYDPVIDTRMYLVEVGNGEGAIGAGGYYPSYGYYTMALDKGWHVGPTNNQDNHKGKWGNANDARDVVLTNDLSQEGIYDAIRNYRIYATEDKNLEINYTLNDQVLGSTVAETSDPLELYVTAFDPDASDATAKVEVVVNSGRVAYTWDDATELATGELSCTLEPTYSYYYIRVTQRDGDIAVTAPVWVGETLKLGISGVECGTSIPVTNEELALITTFFNSEDSAATVKSITYSIGDDVIGTDSTTHTIPASGTLAVDFQYTPTVARIITVTVSAEMEQDGTSYTYTKDITLDVLDASKLVYIGIDASHYNEYVAGNYKDSMGNFGELAAGYAVRTVELDTSEALIAACENADGKYKMMILTAPSRRLGAALTDPRTYSQEELDALATFSAAGGAVVLAGWSDKYEYYDKITENPDVKHMAATQNEVLAALGSSLRISDDATSDDSLNGGDISRLYFSTYNWDHFLTQDVVFDADHPNDRLYSQVFSHYGGASLYAVDAEGQPVSTLPETVSPLVYGHSSTYSVDFDKDGLGGDTTPKYAVSEGDDRLMVMATEQMEGKGLVVVSGAAFMSNFEVQAALDSGSEKNYSNYTICENLVNYVNPITITDIADVQAEPEEGRKFNIEGVVTSNASGYDSDTAFFDCIYLQDDTAGINAFPVAGNYQVGDQVRITGSTSSYQGERQIKVTSIKHIGEGSVKPTTITAEQLNDGSVLGSLVKLSGTVASYESANGLVQTIMVRDSAGQLARVFIDGYITVDEDVQNLRVGRDITVIGLASYDNTFNAPDGPFARIRVRDRDDVVCKAIYDGDDDDDDDNDDDKPQKPADEIPFKDVSDTAWYYDAVCYVYEEGLFNGVSDTKFSPTVNMSRSMLATILYRMSDEKYTGASAAFTDVDPDTWYTEAIGWAADNGIVLGYGDGTFGPDDPITREQIAVMLFRYCKWDGSSTAGQGSVFGFADAAQLSGFASEAMQWALGNGIVTGRPGNLLAPLATASRAEVATMLMRYLED